MRVLVAMCLLTACGSAVIPAEGADPNWSNWSIEPAELEFGDTRLGVPASGEVRFTNTANSELVLSGLTTSEAALTASGELGVVLAPGEETPITVVVTASELGPIDGVVRVYVSEVSGAELGYRPFTVGARGTGPVAGVTATSQDFGELSADCVANAQLTVENSGTVALNVLSLGFDDAQGFGLQYPLVGGAPSEPPWTLLSGDTRAVNLTFVPVAEGEVLANLMLLSDDQLNPVLRVPFTVTVAEGHAASETFEVTANESVTGLVAVNEVVNNTYAPQFKQGLPTFFETLQRSGQPYRIAFTHSVDGSVTGSVPYIDESRGAAEATDITLAMVAGASGDNDYLLNALDLGVEENESWLLTDEEVAWSTSKLNLVGINSDQEQSSGNATFYVNHYLARKADPGDIAVHGIGGDDPAGCPGAEPFTPFADAALATGGVFLSICEADWTANMERLALAFLDTGRTAFRLSEVADVGTVTVYVDEVPRVGGWTFHTGANVVTFDEDAAPTPGSQVRVDYTVASGCGE